MPATSGELALVPHTFTQPSSGVLYTDTGVAHAATAATSLVIRPAQPLSVCQEGLANKLQPLPLPDGRSGSNQTSSDQPRAFSARCRLVPPTATTYGSEAG